jgi:5-methylcytosine-specific restriction protein B
MFRNLFDENIDLNQRFDNFKQKAKTLLEIYRSSHPEAQKANNHFQDTNTISTYLWFKYPDKYYKYAPGIYCSNRLKLGLYQYCIKDRDRTIDSMLQGFAMYDEIRAKLLKDKELVDLINSRVGDLHLEKDFEDDFRTATIDFGYFVSKHFQPTTQFSQEQVINMNNSEFNKKVSEIADVLGFKKNIILQGAPGTGKTYITAAVALKILGGDDQDFDFSDHPAVMGEYEKYRDKKRIFFTTFHQSMDYEDFVEGLKPELVKETEQNDYSNSTEKNVGVTYVCKRGIFKEACQAARVGQEFSKWLDDFLNSIIGFENKKEIPTVTGKSKIYVWWNIGNKTISVRPVSSTFEPVDRFVAAPNIEKIKLQATDEEEGKEPNYTSYAQAIIKYVCSEYGANTQNDGKNNVVLIIDEINRGNVSKIFGELVTLLEKDKREYDAHPISVTLPYSKEEFSVPSNVYIIGTMNTTDRSTGTLDYAIRRRFAFVTLKADEKVLPENSKARALFNDIKSFIGNDKNHPQDMDIDDLMVGHSYFMAENEDKLKLKIEYEVIPLLKEYLNDGLLTCSQEVFNKHIEAWIKLETFKQDSNTATNTATTESETSQSNE